ncbi:MAG: HypC/HybG/HupF family hydrogenase formation chaperone [Gemmatimonadetes bacterium]|nr:HypC/HybG/HupF family hydrogenase formation chaperone [Gemmatimonadota bacterium]
MSKHRRLDGTSAPLATEPPGACIPDAHGRCGVCADEGRVGEVLEISPEGPEARVRFPEGTRSVDLALVEGVRPGDRLLVHLDTALAVVEAPS